MCSSEVQKFHSYFFAKSTINDVQDEWKLWFLVYVISYKALFMYIYPYNMNKTAMLYSINFFLFYVSCMVIYIYTL